MRLLAVLAVVAALSAAAGTVTSTALADPPVDPFTDLRTNLSGSTWAPSVKDLIKERVGSSSSYTTVYNVQGAAEKKAMSTWMLRGRIAARVLPRLATRATLPLTAAWIGWTIYRSWGDNSDPSPDDTVQLWLDAPALGSDALLSPSSLPTGAYPGFGTSPPVGNITYNQVQWRRLTTIQSGTGSWNEACPSTYSPSEGCWRLDIKAHYNGYYDYTIPGTGTTWGANNRVEEHICGYSVEIASGNPDGCWYSNSPWDWADATRALAYLVWESYENVAADGKATKTVTPWYDKSPSTANKLTNFYGYFRSADQLEGMLVDDPAGSGSSSAQTYNVPADAGDTSADIDGFLDPFDTVCGRALINHTLDPTHYAYPTDCTSDPPATEPSYDAGTMTLLQPGVNETYTAYIARLQAAGWLGTATTNELTTDDPLAGASAVSKIKYGTSVLAPSAWPTTAVTIATSTNLTIWHNKATAPPATDPGGAGGGGLPGGSAGECVCPGVDFDPLTGLSAGDKFPFALFTFAASALGAFAVEPDAPSWSFAMPEGVTGTYDIDLVYFDEYMSTLRTIISVILWIGSVWWFANRILGLNVGDNPAEAAADETSL